MWLDVMAWKPIKLCFGVVTNSNSIQWPALKTLEIILHHDEPHLGWHNRWQLWGHLIKRNWHVTWGRHQWLIICRCAVNISSSSKQIIMTNYNLLNFVSNQSSTEKKNNMIKVASKFPTWIVALDWVTSAASAHRPVILNSPVRVRLWAHHQFFCCKFIRFFYCSKFWSFSSISCDTHLPSQSNSVGTTSVLFLKIINHSWHSQFDYCGHGIPGINYF